MFSLTAQGDYNDTTSWLENLESGDLNGGGLDRFGQMGVDALSQATPKETGLTSESWEYEINEGGGVTSIEWYNTNVVAGTSVALLLQYGHGTGTGGYVQGEDYINPTMQPIFDMIEDEFIKEVQQ